MPWLEATAPAKPVDPLVPGPAKRAPQPNGDSADTAHWVVPPPCAWCRRRPPTPAPPFSGTSPLTTLPF